ncbi:MAG: GNAT family N-acetyltransferase [Chloroflexia bacterium]|nr:GNAT family N-acetyltransferase [Chloroflexia bacterium]
MSNLRVLEPDDEAALQAFLLPRVDSSMFLLGNMRAAGLRDEGRAYQGTYVGAWEGAELVGVAAHYWNGNLVLQATGELEALCHTAIKASGRPLRGLVGPAGQVEAARLALGLTAAPVQLDEEEHLYALALRDLAVPPALADGRLRGRRIEPHDVELLTAWRVGFSTESLGDEESPRLWASCRAAVERGMAEGRIWLLEDEGRPVSTTAFNTAIREAVQVGGVWTPPELRSRGYGRAAVAASLLAARAEGATRGVLFTGQENVPAQRAYEALGFRRVGDYRLLLLHPPSS